MVPTWIGNELPDVCCTCGMFTDNRVKIKHSILTTKTGASGMSILLVIIGLFLGPIGWLLTAFTADDDETPKTVRKKLKFKISQCILCAGETTPEVLNVEPESGRFEAMVHERFADRLQTMELEAIRLASQEE